VFIDEIKVRVRSGRGGAGALSFRHEKHVPLGGPDGGDGGRGADVYLVASGGLSSLSHLKGKRLVSGGAGGKGSRNHRHGADAESVRVLVPSQTVAHDLETGDVVGELGADGDELLVAKGGRGGRGNAHFATSRQRAPRFAELGGPGVERELLLELKLIADVGLVGAPNAGKSTLLAALTAATPKIADYPFTTTEPGLGVTELEDGSRLVLADVPGLIEGASQGSGLGTAFLKHLSRTRAVVHVLDCGPDVEVCRRTFDQVQAELQAYDPGLWSRTVLVALNKIDLPFGEEHARELAAEIEATGLSAVSISAAEKVGTDALLAAMIEAVQQSAPAEPRLMVYRPTPAPPSLSVKKSRAGYVVRGKSVEAIVAKTDINSPAALTRMRRQLDGLGLREALLAAGAQGGDTVVVGGVEFVFDPDL
jgi:GTP-binding protein